VKLPDLPTPALVIVAPDRPVVVGARVHVERWAIDLRGW
jgi:hypothetical protein